MSKTMTTLFVVIAVLAAAVVSNPSADRHRSKIKDAIAERSQLEKILGVGHLAAFAARYHSLTVASYTIVNEKLMSIGAFGIVYVPE